MVRPKPSNHSLQLGPGMDRVGDDYQMYCSHPIDEVRNFDLLLFTDSKGSSLDKSESPQWTKRLMQDFDDWGLSYLSICRPKELTTFFSLIQFMQRNPFHFRYLVTNMGFVDYTPKKSEFVQDIIDQCPDDFNIPKNPWIKLCNYTLSDGSSAELFSLDYGPLEQYLANKFSGSFDYTLLIGVQEMASSLSLPRKRPETFYSQLLVTNNLLFNIASQSHSIHYFQPLKFPYADTEGTSHDGVHFTDYGHKKLYDLLLPVLQLYLR